MYEDVRLRECQALGLDSKLADRIQRSFAADRDAQLGMFEFTLLLVKHYCLDKREDILDGISEAGLQVIASKKALLGRMDVVRFAIIHVHGKKQALDVVEHSATLESLLKGPVEAFIVAGADAVNRLGLLLGPQNPSEARLRQPKSLRAQFGGETLNENGLHCSARRSEAHEEISQIFPNYIDLLKSKGYHSQVDEWLFSLWRSEPSRTLFKNKYLEIQRYSGSGQPDRTPELFGVIHHVTSYLRGKVTSCLSAIGSLIPFTSSSNPSATASNSDGTPSAMRLSQQEEEQIACAALADELGVTDLSPYFPTRSTLIRRPVTRRTVPVAPRTSDEEVFVDAVTEHHPQQQQHTHGEWLRPHNFASSFPTEHSHDVTESLPQLAGSQSATDFLPAESKAFSDTFLTRPGGPNFALTAASEVASAVEMFRPSASTAETAETAPRTGRRTSETPDGEMDMETSITSSSVLDHDQPSLSSFSSTGVGDFGVRSSERQTALWSNVDAHSESRGGKTS
ncbi:hypothetical protein BV898_11833 [Hypsibius exemplaris]|uniref:Nucleoside diphosphate kinase-like domain-containing protein n=1 Tax=Hypsibius exemplaris TaxID=2072580 RepID=A0A1W0WFH6_HYPEX|nr:hypothetical protein BV898_11833 [Hypsibius exemplaris]